MTGIIRRIDPFVQLSVILPFALYLLTLAPSVTFFDSGEFLTAIHSLGTAHSPGYPLFINYAKPFTFLPFGSIAFRVNIATAFSASVACFSVYLLVSHLLDKELINTDFRFATLIKKSAGLAAAITFACSPRLWLQSNHDKPYPLIAIIVAMVFYLLLLWRDHYREGDERPGYVYLGALLCGLAFGAHQTIVLMVPVYAFMIISLDLKLIYRVKEMMIALAFFILGFSIHLHLPVRATRNPILNWGDPKTLTQFLWDFLRKGYPVEKPPRNFDLFWSQVSAFNLPHEFTWVGVAILLAGLIAFRGKWRQEIVAYLLACLIFIAVIAGYFNTPMELIFLTEEFFTPLYMLSAVFIGLGLFTLVRFGLFSVPPKMRNNLSVLSLLAIILLALPASLCAVNYYENDQHENYIAFDYASNTLRSLPQGAVLFTWGDSGAFPLWYLQGVERMREDCDVLHTPHLVFPWYLDSFPALFRYSLLRNVPPDLQVPEAVLPMAISEQILKRPVYLDYSTRFSVEIQSYTVQQEGITYRLEPGAGRQLTPNISLWDIYSLRSMSGAEMPFRDLDTGKAILIYANTLVDTGDFLIRQGRRDMGVRFLARAAEISPQSRLQVDQLLRGYGLQ